MHHLGWPAHAGGHRPAVRSDAIVYDHRRWPFNGGQPGPRGRNPPGDPKYSSRCARIFLREDGRQVGVGVAGEVAGELAGESVPLDGSAGGPGSRIGPQMVSDQALLRRALNREYPRDDRDRRAYESVAGSTECLEAPADAA